MTTATASRNEIRSMRGKELVGLFNELTTGNPVKKFSNRETGVKRTLAAYDLAFDVEDVKKKPEKASKSEIAPVGDIARKRRMTFPVKDVIKAHRQGTRRAQVIQMLKRANGATIQQVMKEIPEWDYRTAFEGIKLIHVYTGYGLEEDDKGYIRLKGEPTA